MAQFGLVSYIPTYAVAEWSFTASAAAMLLFVGRVFSIPGKAVAGWMKEHDGLLTREDFANYRLAQREALILLEPDLTGIPNRRNLEEFLAREIPRAERHGRPRWKPRAEFGHVS